MRSQIVNFLAATVSLGASVKAFSIPSDEDRLQDRSIIDALQHDIRRRDIITAQQLNASYGKSLM